MDELDREVAEFALNQILTRLAKAYFPQIGSVPKLEVRDASKDGPAWLNAIEGIIYIDERVAQFQKKTAQILILHELIHYSLYVENDDPDEAETERFERELSRLKRAGAYVGLL
jgi:hypothetical protein